MAEISDEQLANAFATAARFLKDKCEHEGWQWSSNFLREYVRCSTGLQFSNTRSPAILRIVKDKYPALREWIDVATLKDENQPKLFGRDK